MIKILFLILHKITPMHIEQLRTYCISKKGVTEHFPFDVDTLVFKVMDKMFALVPLSKWERGEKWLNLKCNPEKAVELREEFEAIKPGYHMSKKHWNTITVNEDVSDEMIIELIDHSYDLVVAGLTKKAKAELANL
jgi:predicted DNA-binding protein (MmcQ/YjbR family)